jgi:hypothetical protein
MILPLPPFSILAAFFRHYFLRLFHYFSLRYLFELAIIFAATPLRQLLRRCCAVSPLRFRLLPHITPFTPPPVHFAACRRH